MGPVSSANDALPLVRANHVQPTRLLFELPCLFPCTREAALVVPPPCGEVEKRVRVNTLYICSVRAFFGWGRAVTTGAPPEICFAPLANFDLPARGRYNLRRTSSHCFLLPCFFPCTREDCPSSLPANCSSIARVIFRLPWFFPCTRENGASNFSFNGCGARFRRRTPSSRPILHPSASPSGQADYG
jgi:hypothetical protein